MQGQLPTIKGYRLVRRLGGGGMADVYEAVDETLLRTVALKVIIDRFADQEDFRLRFVAEGRAVADFAHRNIVLVHRMAEENRRYFIDMEYVDDGTLSERIAAGMSPSEAISVLTQIAQALEYAHHRRVVHRDVKPANILFRSDGTVVLSDFGIAKVLTETSGLTAPGLAIGTGAYMSPEQIAGGDLDGRSDLYSLGVVFFEMLRGFKPYRADSLVGFAVQHTQAPIPELPATLAKYQPLLRRLLAKSPNQRFGDAGELITAVRELSDTKVSASSPARTSRTPAGTQKTELLTPPSRRARVALPLTLTAVAGVVAAGAYLQRDVLSCSWRPLRLQTEYLFRRSGEDNFETLTAATSLASGDDYKIRFVASRDSHLYVFQTDSSGQIYRLFPAEDVTEFANPVRAGEYGTLPGQDYSYQLDDQTGTERLHLYAFLERQPELEDADQDTLSKALDDYDAAAGKLTGADCGAADTLTFEHVASNDK